MRKLGKSNPLEVSAIELGCMGMSFSYGPPKHKQEMTDLLRRIRSGRRDNLKSSLFSYWYLEQSRIFAKDSFGVTAHKRQIISVIRGQTSVTAEKRRVVV